MPFIIIFIVANNICKTDTTYYEIATIYDYGDIQGLGSKPNNAQP